MEINDRTPIREEPRGPINKRKALKKIEARWDQ